MAVAEKVHIIGIGDDGLEGLTTFARKLIDRADLLIGDETALAGVAQRAAFGDGEQH